MANEVPDLLAALQKAVEAAKEARAGDGERADARAALTAEAEALRERVETEERQQKAGDPRILPAEELARYKAEVRRVGDGYPCGCASPHTCIRRLIEHGEALTEQVDTLTRERDEARDAAEAALQDAQINRMRTERAEVERDVQETSARFWAEQCAIRDLADHCDQMEQVYETGREIGDALRALLTED